MRIQHTYANLGHALSNQIIQDLCCTSGLQAKRLTFSGGTVVKPTVCSTCNMPEISFSVNEPLGLFFVLRSMPNCNAMLRYLSLMGTSASEKAPQEVLRCPVNSCEVIYVASDVDMRPNNAVNLVRITRNQFLCPCRIGRSSSPCSCLHH